MRYGGVLLAAAVVVACNSLVLIGVARNRAGEPRARIELTERELVILPLGEENTGLLLELRWDNPSQWRPHRFEDGPGWFDRRKLEELGYDCRMEPADPGAEEHYRRALPIEAYVVLEYEGEAWQQWQSRPPEPPAPRFEPARPPEPERERLSHTRLFAVDVGRDASRLRQKYAETGRFLTVPGQVRLVRESRRGEETGKPAPAYLRGVIADVFLRRIHVPLEQSRSLDAFRKTPSLTYFQQSPLGSLEPRYTVTLAIGARYEPWIVAIQPQQR